MLNVARLLAFRGPQQPAWLISLGLLSIILLAWHVTTLQPSFNSSGLTEEQLMTLEFKGDIVRTDSGGYIYNPEKSRGIPGPLSVLQKTLSELSEAFEKKGTNDHGIAFLIRYTVTRFAAGFLSASLVAP
jgi:nitrate/nitrite transport system permease protein